MGIAQILELCSMAIFVISATAVKDTGDANPKHPVTISGNAANSGGLTYPSLGSDFNIPLSSLPEPYQRLWMAVDDNNGPLIEELLLVENVSPDFGATGISLLHYSVLHLDMITFETVLSRCEAVDTLDQTGNTPLHWAVLHNWPAATLLLAHGANANVVGSLGTSLSLAIHTGTDEVMLRLLLENGADLKVCDRTGYGPIHVAAAQKTPMAFWLLLDWGANAFQLDIQGCTPFHHAVASGSLEVIEYLLNEGADVNSRCRGNTPLHIATRRSRLDVYDILCEHGADAELRDSTGVTAHALRGWMVVRESLDWMLNNDSHSIAPAA